MNLDTEMAGIARGLAPAGAAPQPGTLLRVKIAEATPHSLIGECPPGETPGRIRRSVKDDSELADEKGGSALFGG